MRVAMARIGMRAEHVDSLKEKRSIVKSLVERLKNRFEVSAAEVDDMDVHRSIVIGIACVSGGEAHARERIEAAIRFVEGHPEAEVVSVDVQIAKLEG